MTDLPKVLDEIVSVYQKERYPQIKKFLLENVNSKMNEKLLECTSEYIYSELEPFFTEKEKATEDNDDEKTHDKYEAKVFDKTVEILKSLVPEFAKTWVNYEMEFVRIHFDTIVKLEEAVKDDDFHIKKLNSQK